MTITRNIAKKQAGTDHTRFGGLVYASDFNTDIRGKDQKNGSAIASRIVNDYRFDEQCRKNITYREGTSIA